MGSINIGRISIGRAAAAILLALVAISATAGASTATPRSERHCIVEVIGNVDGALVTGPEICYPSRSGAARQIAAVTAAPALSASPGGVSRAAGGTNIIGVHYTSTNYGGSSITIIGTTCSGGVWRALGWWNNNIESSRHYCGGSPTTFYDRTNCTGATISIYGNQSSLGSLNNRVSCVRYG